MRTDRLYLLRRRLRLAWHIYRRSTWGIRAAWQTSGTVQRCALEAMRAERADSLDRLTLEKAI